MCKFCDLELNKRMILCHKNFPYDFGDNYCNKFPEDIKEYISYMSNINDEGYKWRIEDDGKVFLIMYNEGGYNATELECKFCPKCGNKLEETIKEVK
jgi:hypothetical protein